MCISTKYMLQRAPVEVLIALVTVLFQFPITGTHWYSRNCFIILSINIGLQFAMNSLPCIDCTTLEYYWRLVLLEKNSIGLLFVCI